MSDPTPEPDKRSTLEDALIEAGKLLGLEVAQLKAALARKDEALRRAWDRMDLARAILMDRGGNWGMLDTKRDREAPSVFEVRTEARDVESLVSFLRSREQSARAAAFEEAAKVAEASGAHPFVAGEIAHAIRALGKGEK